MRIAKQLKTKSDKTFTMYYRITFENPYDLLVSIKEHHLWFYKLPTASYTAYYNVGYESVVRKGMLLHEYRNEFDSMLEAHGEINIVMETTIIFKGVPIENETVPTDELYYQFSDGDIVKGAEDGTVSIVKLANQKVFDVFHWDEQDETLYKVFN